jgi:hypothetical protein
MRYVLLAANSIVEILLEDFSVDNWILLEKGFKNKGEKK